MISEDDEEEDDGVVADVPLHEDSMDEDSESDTDTDTTPTPGFVGCCCCGGGGGGLSSDLIICISFSNMSMPSSQLEAD